MSRKNFTENFSKITVIFFVVIMAILIITLSIFFREYYIGEKERKVERKVVNVKSASRTVYPTSGSPKIENNYKWSGTINKIEYNKIFLSADFKYKNKDYANQEITIQHVSQQTNIIKYDLSQNSKTKSINLSDLKVNDKIIIEAKNNLNDKFEVEASKISLLITAAK